MNNHQPSMVSATIICTLMSMASLSDAIADRLDFSSEDTVTVTADRAWEGEEVDVIHFSGNFVLRAPDWSLTGDSAVTYGNLDDPERIVVTGKPAKISFLRQPEDNATSADESDRVDGSASVVEYFRSSDKLVMRGDASLTKKDSTLAGDNIEYNVDTDRYAASGERGIRLVLNPDDE